MDNDPAMKRPVAAYHIDAGARVKRESSTADEWFHTQCHVTYHESDVIRTYFNPDGPTIWVFRLPSSAFPWIRLEVDQRDVYFEGDI